MASHEFDFPDPGSNKIGEQLPPSNEVEQQTPAGISVDESSIDMTSSHLMTPPQNTNLDNQGWANNYHPETDNWYALNLENALTKVVQQNLDPHIRSGLADNQQVWQPNTTQDNSTIQQPATPQSQSTGTDRSPQWQNQFLTPQSLPHNRNTVSASSQDQWQQDQSLLPPTPTPQVPLDTDDNSLRLPPAISQNQALLAKFHKDEWFAWSGRGSTQSKPAFVNYGIDGPIVNDRLFQRPKFGQLPTIVSINTPPGDFGEIPLEVFMRIIGNLTLSSFFNLLRCSKWIKNSMEMHPYRQKISQAHLANVNVMRTIVDTGVSRFFNIRVVDIFFEWQCYTCGEIGNLLFLPNMSRACKWCLENHNSYDVVVRTVAGNIYKINDRNLRQIPTAKVAIQSRPARSFYVASKTWAFNVGVRIHGGYVEMMQRVNEADQRKIESYNARLRLWQASKGDKSKDPYRHLNDEDAPHEVDEQFATIALPMASSPFRMSVSQPRPPKLSSHYAVPLGFEYRAAASIRVKYRSPFKKRKFH
ncbi:hypothetical protein EDC01DRAFT_745053 [Geopyxis carbonaria]|nr:hypothetical protein EDC01DRAFT_745053 [Geopyxis carbonaria]